VTVLVQLTVGAFAARDPFSGKLFCANSTSIPTEYTGCGDGVRFSLELPIRGVFCLIDFPYLQVLYDFVDTSSNIPQDTSNAWASAALAQFAKDLEIQCEGKAEVLDSFYVCRYVYFLTAARVLQEFLVDHLT